MSGVDQSTLFVYGSLLDTACRERILGHRVATRPARLEGFRVGRGRYFYIVAAPGASTEGLLLVGLDAEDLARLDRYEELPRLYTREAAEVITPDGRLRCWVYMPARAVLEG